MVRGWMDGAGKSVLPSKYGVQMSVDENVVKSVIYGEVNIRCVPSL